MINNPRLVIDVSSWDDHLDVPLLKKAGVAAVIVKCGSGMRRDAKFLSHAQAVVDGGLLLMAYYWDDILSDPVAQAEWVVDDLHSTGLPVKFIWADQEQWWTSWEAWQAARNGELPYSAVPRASATDISLHNQIFAETLNKLYSQSGVYSNYGFVTSWAPQIKNWIGNMTLWIAHYGRQPKAPTETTWEKLEKEWSPDYPLLLPPGAKEDKVVGHQFTGDIFRLPGVYNASGTKVVLDVSIFSEKFLDLVSDGKTPPALPKEDPPETPKEAGKYVVNVATVNVRKGPGTQYEVAGTLSKNTTVQVTEIRGNWAHLDDETWVYAPYLTLIEATSTPPSDPTPIPTEGEKYYVNVPAVNVRKGPGTQYAVAGIYSKDTVVNVVKIEGSWAHLDNDNWIYAPYITKVESSDTSTEPADPTEPTKPTEPTEPTEPAEPSNGEAYYVNVPAVNVRKGPGTQYGIAGIYSKNTVVKVVEIQGSWAHLNNDNWIYMPYLTKGEPTAQLPESEPADTATITTDGKEYFVNVPAVNVRKGPGTQYDIVGISSQGTKVKVTDVQGTWAHLESDTWVYAPYLSLAA